MSSDLEFMPEDEKEDSPAAKSENEEPTLDPHDFHTRAEKDRQRLYQRYAESQRDPVTDNLRRFLKAGTEDEEEAAADWEERSGSEEATASCDRFMRANRLTSDSPVWKKMNNPGFYMKHRDLLELRQAGRYDLMFAMAKERAEREMELDARRGYINALHNQRNPAAESFEAYRKRMAKAAKA